MKGAAGKAPSIQWYYKDWLSDRQLQRATSSSRGIWMNLLMHMVDCSTNNKNCREGKLEDMTIQEIMQLGSCNEDEAWQFLEDAIRHEFCNVLLDKNRTFSIMSRRMSRDAVKRKKWREKKRLQREYKDVYHKGPKSVPPKSPRSPTPTPTPSNIHIHIVEYLNQKTGKDFSPKTKTTISHINARINEGHSLDDFKKVIDIKTSKWLKDPERVEYLRPQTLFGTKFESYLNEKPKPNSKPSTTLPENEGPEWMKKEGLI